MLHLTQLVYVHPGQEAAFLAFEAVVLPLIERHGGTLLLRLRPGPEAKVEGALDAPYEVHVVRFPSDEAFARFAADDARQAVLHLKRDAVRATLLLRGTAS
jgi:uncharacterized protein (DUF1330 family)